MSLRLLVHCCAESALSCMARLTTELQRRYQGTLARALSGYLSGCNSTINFIFKQCSIRDRTLLSDEFPYQSTAFYVLRGRLTISVLTIHKLPRLLVIPSQLACALDAFASQASFLRSPTSKPSSTSSNTFSIHSAIGRPKNLRLRLSIWAPVSMTSPMNCSSPSSTTLTTQKSCVP
jgi:hypothetical protein